MTLPHRSSRLSRSLMGLEAFLSPSDRHQGQSPSPDWNREGTCRGRGFAPGNVSAAHALITSELLLRRFIPSQLESIEGCQQGHGGAGQVRGHRLQRSKPSRRVLMPLGRWRRWRVGASSSPPPSCPSWSRCSCPDSDPESAALAGHGRAGRAPPPRPSSAVFHALRGLPGRRGSGVSCASVELKLGQFASGMTMNPLRRSKAGGGGRAGLEGAKTAAAAKMLGTYS